MVAEKSKCLRVGSGGRFRFVYRRGWCSRLIYFALSLEGSALAGAAREAVSFSSNKGVLNIWTISGSKIETICLVTREFLVSERLVVDKNDHAV